MRAVPAATEDFWRALAVSMMYHGRRVLRLAARDLRKNLDMLVSSS